ncbi:MAG TPA: amidohydrolase family protein [Nocardioidaceae bacterium]|jgi:hypothetical protein
MTTTEQRPTFPGVAAGTIVDTMVQVYVGPNGSNAPIPRESFRDAASLDAWPTMALVRYLFRGAGSARMDQAGELAAVVSMLDEWGVDIGIVPVSNDEAEAVLEQLSRFGERFAAAVRVNPHTGMEAVRRLEALTRAFPVVKACAITPHFLWPPLPPNSKECYPIYAKCVELGLPVCINVGIPGPRVPGDCQNPMHLDEVCWFFPELTVVMKHGGEPWADVCVKLMLKWPNLFYTTSGFAPRYYPREIVEYANTRGGDRILYAGYFPMLGYDDVFLQLPSVPFRDHVWPRFLGENARRVFGLGRSANAERDAVLDG